MRLFDFCTTLGVILIVYKKRSEASTLTNRKLKEIVYVILPKATASTLMVSGVV